MKYLENHDAFREILTMGKQQRPKLQFNVTIKCSAFSLPSCISLIRLLFLPAGEKHHMLPTGELLVFSVTPADAHSTYRCRTVHHVTGDTVESSSYARLVVTGKFSQDLRLSVELPRVEVQDSANAILISRKFRKYHKRKENSRVNSNKHVKDCLNNK